MDLLTTSIHIYASLVILIDILSTAKSVNNRVVSTSNWDGRTQSLVHRRKISVHLLIIQIQSQDQ